MRPTVYQVPELRDENNNIIQNGAFLSRFDYSGRTVSACKREVLHGGGDRQVGFIERKMRLGNIYALA